MELFNRTSTRPHVSSVSEATSRTDWRSSRSIRMGRHLAPSASISLAVVSRLPGMGISSVGRAKEEGWLRPSPSRTVRAVMTTSQPAQARARATQRTIPRLASVTRATGAAPSLVNSLVMVSPQLVGGGCRRRQVCDRWTPQMTPRYEVGTAAIPPLTHLGPAAFSVDPFPPVHPSRPSTLHRHASGGSSGSSGFHETPLMWLPPSTNNGLPGRYGASRLARNRATGAMSASGSPSRPIGFISSAMVAISGCSAATARKAALLAPGQMTLAMTPYCAHSRAAVRVNVRNASLAQLYSSVPMWALTPFNEHKLMMFPRPCARINGNAACIAQKGP